MKISSPRSLWFGLLGTAFFVWLMIDSITHTSAFRFIYPDTKSSEAGSVMIVLGNARLAISILDQLRADADYSNSDSREPRDARAKLKWWPKLESSRDSVMRTRSLSLPTWILLVLWLGTWFVFHRRSLRAEQPQKQPTRS
ncbi:hypothetical protein ACFQY0_01365 [Haloferula chungangensis]|uniref:Uncharacterized protein n=1 Tax=Haloferula chungangensis TaxID=1048331 RepID=A0ABW2L3F1_9BACT